MRFMMLVKASAESEAGVMPSAEALQAMGRYNGELIKAGGGIHCMTAFLKRDPLA